MPIEPPPTDIIFPDPAAAGDSDDVAAGGDLEPGTVLAAYRQGLFPMPVRGQIHWWSPVERGVIPVEGLKVSRSLAKSMRRYTVTMDREFDKVIRACADPNREHAWIDSEVVDSYTRLHKLGWVHSFETWLDDRLVGGLYGVALGGLFAGESMFHLETDASKVALVHLVNVLVEGDGKFIDVQWSTPHLASLGAVAVSRSEYLEMLKDALAVPLPTAFQS